MFCVAYGSEENGVVCYEFGNHCYYAITIDGNELDIEFAEYWDAYKLWDAITSMAWSAPNGELDALLAA